MSELTKLETLQKAVVDTKAARSAAYDAYADILDVADDAWDVVYDAAAASVKAKLLLEEYLKEQDSA